MKNLRKTGGGRSKAVWICFSKFIHFGDDRLGKESAHPKENALSDLQERRAQPEPQGPPDAGQEGVQAELDRSRDGRFHCVLKGDVETWLI